MKEIWFLPKLACTFGLQIDSHKNNKNMNPSRLQHAYTGYGAYASYPMSMHPKANQGFFIDLQKNEENESNNQRKACYGTKATY